MPFDVEYVAHKLGPEGPGFVQLTECIPPETNEQIATELSPQNVPWVPQYNRYENQRGIEVKQAFDVFAHKYGRGDQAIMERLPAFNSLGSLVTKQIVEPLTEYFQSLKTWELDELSAQRYPHAKGVLTWHRDLARHPGIIAICNITGEATLSARDTHHQECPMFLMPGDVVVLRAPGLFDKNLIEGSIRPEHAVTNIHGSDDRISITARANSSPDQPIKNFYYHNWGPQPAS